MLEVEVIGIDATESDPAHPPTAVELEELCALALSSAGIDEGHVAIEFVDARRSRELNREYRRIAAPTAVLSFGAGEDAPRAGPRQTSRPARAEHGLVRVHPVLRLVDTDGGTRLEHLVRDLERVESGGLEELLTQ